MNVLQKFFAQSRKPEGFLGKVMVGGMNGGHAKLADWGMQFLPPGAPENVLEIGCGGGRTAGELLKRFPASHVTAIDYSPVSVDKTAAYNKEMIAAGRCSVRAGNASDLPFSDGTFQLVTAFETVYFWPGLINCFSEVCRVLKPGGVFLICNESDGTDETALKFEKIIDGMKCYTVDDLKAALLAAGFFEVKGEHHTEKPWITVIARK